MIILLMCKSSPGLDSCHIWSYDLCVCVNGYLQIQNTEEPLGMFDYISVNLQF